MTDSIIKDALAYMFERGQSMTEWTAITEKEGEILYADPQGMLHREPRDLPQLAVTVENLNSLLDLCDPEQNPLSTSPMIWISRSGLTAVLDSDARRRHRIYLQFERTAPFERICEWSKNETMLSQRALIARLRHEFRGIVPASLVTTLGQIKIEAGRIVDSEVGHGHDTLKTKTTSKVSVLDSIPDVITVTPRLWNNMGMGYAEPIELTLAIDPASGNFGLHATEDEIATAIQAAQSQIAQQIQAADPIPVPFVFGKPSIR